MIIDTHCHIYRSEYDDFDQIIEKIKRLNMKIVVSGYDKDSNYEVIKLSEEYNFVYATIGYDPSCADKLNNEDFLLLESQLNNKKVVGIGEIGLDYYWNSDNKQNQQDIFIRQLEIANKHFKPVTIHNREATSDVYNILSHYNLKGVIHAFSGSFEMAKNFIDLGFLLGIGGVLTFKNSNLKDVIKKLELENIVLETDSPYLTPEPKRGKKNNPTYIEYIAKNLALLKETTYDEICDITTKNSMALFDLR